jgi:hypothetical protein
MNWIVSVYSAILFFIFSTDTFFKIAVDDNIYKTAVIHAIIFALVFHFTYKIVWGLSMFIGFRPLNYNLKTPEAENKLDNIFKSVFDKKENMQNMGNKENIEKTIKEIFMQNKI